MIGPPSWIVRPCPQSKEKGGRSTLVMAKATLEMLSLVWPSRQSHRPAESPAASIPDQRSNGSMIRLCSKNARRGAVAALVSSRR